MHSAKQHANLGSFANARLAIALSGQTRTYDQCAASLERAFSVPFVVHAATWSNDGGCKDSTQQPPGKLKDLQVGTAHRGVSK